MAFKLTKTETKALLVLLLILLLAALGKILF